MRVFLVLMLGVILLLTLWPLKLRAPLWSLDIAQPLFESLSRMPKRGDAIRNVLLFIPFGYALTVVVGRTAITWRAIALAAAYGFALSLTVESAQVYIAFRTPNLFDVLFNTLGTGIGGFGAWFWRATSRQPVALHTQPAKSV